MLGNIFVCVISSILADVVSIGSKGLGFVVCIDVFCVAIAGADLGHVQMLLRRRVIEDT